MKQEKLDIKTIWWIGRSISGGHGFWGSRELFLHKDPSLMVKAWVDALREKGYSDKDIIFYGDWIDGRKIADEISDDMTYADFYEIVLQRAEDKNMVRKKNAEFYADEILKYKQYFFRR
jgi:hypothetical protein